MEMSLHVVEWGVVTFAYLALADVLKAKFRQQCGRVS